MIGCAPCPRPCSGSMANCMALVKIVMAPTAISPPYFNRDELKQMEIILSLDCMTKVAAPSATHGRITDGVRPILRRRIFKRVFFPARNASTQMVEQAWEITVASAAPRTPICIPKMKTGSSTMLQTAPISTESMPVFANPWAVINMFMPSVSSTKMVPSE